MKEMKHITQSQKQYPYCCRKIFCDCDGILTCNSLNYEYVRDKCLEGKGRCLCRVNRWTGEKDEKGKCIHKVIKDGGNICLSNDSCDCKMFGDFDDPVFCGEEELAERLERHALPPEAKDGEQG